jgi:hypothetical protein
MSVKIFLSAVSDEFLEYRDQLRRDLTRHNVEVKVQEDFKDYGGDTLDKLDLYISSCDAVVHLVGDMAGAEPVPASGLALLAKYRDILTKLPALREAVERAQAISYTQWEAWLALYHRKLLVIAEADEAAPRGPRYVVTENSRVAQKQHLQRLQDFERYGAKFTSPDNLAKIILSSAILDLLTKGHDREPFGVFRKLPYASLIAALLLLLLTPLTAEHLAKVLGISLAAPISIIAAAGGLVLGLMFWRYLGILAAGAEAAGSLERQAYEVLRESLATGGIAVRLYSRWLTDFLNAVDRFFGDAGMADRTLLPRVFGLRTPAPLWTAPALDRCLLLAFIYPIVTIFIMWSVSGHVGPAEQALGLESHVGVWQRGIVIGAIGFNGFLVWLYMRTTGWKCVTWIFISAAAACTAVAVGAMVGVVEKNEYLLDLLIYVSVGIVSFVTAGIVTVVGKRAGGVAVVIRRAAFNIAGALTIIFGLSASFHSFSGEAAYRGALAVSASIGGIASGSGAAAVVVALFVILVTSTMVEFDVPWMFFALFALPVVLGGFITPFSRAVAGIRWQGLFLSVLLVSAAIGCLISAIILGSSHAWRDDTGPALLFVSLLTLLNAPFDWASLGLTRALLRRGVELKRWWPYLLALVDALAAGVIVVLLALTMVIGVQVFDELAVRSGGKPVLPLAPLFGGIKKHPGSPEFWWVYVLLLSTMIPSVINLMLGGTALMRAIPGLSALLLRYLPSDRGVPTYDRAWIALVLTIQAAGGIILGIAAQALLAVGLILYVMPAAGLELLNLARNVAAFDLPAKILGSF